MTHSIVQISRWPVSGAGSGLGRAERRERTNGARRIVMMRRLCGYVPVLLAGLTLIATRAEAVDLVAHEAMYRLTLLGTSVKGAIVQSHGALGIRMKRQCGAWQSQSELLFTMELDSGKKVRVHNMMRLRENDAGRRVEFTGWTDSDKSGKIDTRGYATIPASEDPGEVMFERPKKDQHKLAIGMGLPTESYVKILDQLVVGETPAPVHFFDPYSKYTEMRLLGGAPTILEKPPEGNPELVEGKSWRLRITPVFESQTFNELGTHTIMQIHANGVASYMILDLGTMTLGASLVKVRQIEPTGCAPASEPAKPETQSPLSEIPQEGISIEEIPNAVPVQDEPQEDKGLEEF